MTTEIERDTPPWQPRMDREPEFNPFARVTEPEESAIPAPIEETEPEEILTDRPAAESGNPVS
jgi:hypothetical protein